MRQDSSLKSSSAQWLSSQLALFTGVLFALLLLMAIGWMSWRGHQQVVDQDLRQQELYARVIEDHASRSFDAVAVVQNSLAETVLLQDSIADLPHLSRQLTQVLSGVPFVRSIAVLDAQGRVLVSSSGADVRRQVNLSLLGPRPARGQTLLGPLIRGRSLTDFEVGASQSELRSGINSLPMMYGFALAGGQPMLVVALINPDALVNFQRQVIGDNPLSVLVTSYTGLLLTSTVDMVGAPGMSLAHHSLFGDRQVAREHGSYREHSAAGEDTLVAFRASRAWPLVVLVEQAQGASTQRWLARARPVLVAGLIVVFMLLGMAVVLYRSLRARERSRVLFDRARDQVVRSERELSVLLRSLQELIFRTDASGVVTYVNARWAALLGAQAHQALGRSVLDVLVPERSTDRTTLFALDHLDGVRHCRASTVGADGRTRHFELAVVPLLVDGRITAFAGSAVDITELLETQRQLQMQLSLIGLMLEISPEPTSMADEQGRLVMVNKAWEQFKGLDRGQVIGKRFADFLPANEAQLHEHSEAQLVRQGGEIRFESRISRYDLGMRDVLISKVMVPGESGALIGVLTVLTDVTEFREAERAIREARDVAEEASRSKSEFVANISHELRTPLQSIIGFSELGVMRGKGSDRIVAMFHDINASGQRMLALVNDLLDVSKIESTVGTFHLESVDLRSLIRPVAREMGPLLARKNLSLDMDLSDLPLVARADPLRFQQVIRNVLANAVKFSPNDQTVALSAQIGDGGEIHIVVRDRGPGIPEAELEKIFEAFVQSSKTKNGSGGTGLGLAICRKIVEGHGGRIHACNVSEGGAEFHIHFPARSGGSDSQTMPLN